MTPDYWSKARQGLAKSDPVLGSIIRAYTGEPLKLRAKGFQTLARAIIGQQISVKAADNLEEIQKGCRTCHSLPCRKCAV
jgi:DNA-3-methyladenine glycosylase II